MGGQYGPPPSEEPDEYPQDGEGGGPGPLRVRLLLLPLQLIREPGVVGDSSSQLGH